MARRVPRLSESYQVQAEYFFIMGLAGSMPWCAAEHSIWFYPMAAWFYEDDDEELARS